MIKSNLPALDRAWLDVDLAALRRNARRFRELIGAPLLPMVKADAYGLGAVAVARALESESPWGYGVATTEEGAALRNADISRPILVLTPLRPPNIDAVLRHRLTPVIGDLEALEAWLASGGGSFHLEIDTGMSRAGFRWHDAAAIGALRRRLATASGFEGAFTHFHSADSDQSATEVQARRFEEVLAALGPRPGIVHLSASAGAQWGARYGTDLARPGIYLFGGRAGSLEPEPVARLCARVVALRRLRPGDTVSYAAEGRVDAATTIVTLSIGYGDGVPRSLAGRGSVELGGRIVPIAGRVTMDMIMVDAGDLSVSLGDVATVFGGRIPLDTHADAAGTISYELLTAISPRVVRRYQDDT